MNKALKSKGDWPVCLFIVDLFFQKHLMHPTLTSKNNSLQLKCRWPLSPGALIHKIQTRQRVGIKR